MASFLLRPHLRPQAIGIGLGLALAGFQCTRQPAVRLDTHLLPGDSYPRSAQTPALKNGGLNPGAVRQISSGSIIGLCAGLAVSTFSKPLTLLIGLVVIAVQVASRYGINVVPYQRLQKYFTSIDLRSAVQDNVAFKLSFGTTFAMAAFMQF